VSLLISWVASAIGGFSSVVALVIGWGAIPATIMAVIGVFRRRCKWYAIPIYLSLIPVGSFGFRGVFWVLERVAQPDTVSTALFWGAVFISGLGALFSAGPTLLKEVWQLTNGSSLHQTPQSASNSSGPLSLDILMHFNVGTDEGVAGLRWSSTQNGNKSLTEEQCKIGLVALLYARTLVNQEETRRPLFDRVAQAARQVLEGKGKFDFEGWTLTKGGLSVCVWPWTVTIPEMVPSPKTYTATLTSSPLSGSFGIHLSMAFGLELVLVPASALIAICGLAKTLPENYLVQLARVLLEINAFYQTRTKFSIGSEPEALKAAMPKL
jgi:uncharacterized repeat protein (TIGR02543 family)